MPVAIDALFLIGGLAAIAVVLIWVFNSLGSRDGKARRMAGQARIRLERRMKLPQGIEETRLLINDQPILAASAEGLRLADYADEVEQLETLATRIASALGVNVELERVPGKGAPAEEETLPVRRLPRDRQDGAAQ